MGNKYLFKLIKQHAPNSISEHKFKDFSGYKIAVDTSQVIYQAIIAVRANGDDLKNAYGNITSHIQVIMYKTISFLENLNVPIYVFDGKPSDLKKEVLEKRRENRKEAEEKLKDLEKDSEEYTKNFKKTYVTTKNDIDELKLLFNIMGIPFIQAIGESDPLMAWLSSNTDEKEERYVKGICSDDIDLISYGGKYLFKDMLKSMKGKSTISMISLSKVLKGMDITMDQLIDLTILLGSDYTETNPIPNIGPVKAYSLIKNLESLEKIIPALLKKKPDLISEETIERMYAARKLFKKAFKTIDKSELVLTKNNLSCRQIQRDTFIDFMVNKHGFDLMSMEKAADRIEAAYKKMNVTRSNKEVYHKLIKPGGTELEFLEDSDEEKN